MTPGERKRWIQERATALGFDRVRFCEAGEAAAPGIEAYDAFIAQGHHADMAWMERGRGPRANPAELLPGVRSAAVFALDYGGPAPPDPGPGYGRVSRYAWGRDYHNLAGKRLRRLCRELRDQGVGAYWSVDSRPVIERAWAQRAGLGFIGKNACAIQPGRGSFFFIGVVFLDLALPPDAPLSDWTRHCGSCRRCLDACPTGALLAPGQVDARRCISYLTIEHDGDIPRELAHELAGNVFGCDICQDVCPHNHRPRDDVHPDLRPREGQAWLDLGELLASADDALLERFRGTPLRRTGSARLKRNARLLLDSG